MSSEWIKREVGGKTVYEPAPSPETDTADDDRFNQEQKEWAAELDEQAVAYLCEFYGVDADDVYDFEGLTSGEYDVDDPTRALQILDYAGVDKIIDCGERIVPVAFRFRPQTEAFDVDFSYCVDNGTGKHAERTKHLNAYRDGGLYPTTYAFGVVAADKSGFDAFHLIDMRDFLACVEFGALDPDGPRERDGGVWALYYSVEELRDAGCILESWGGSHD